MDKRTVVIGASANPESYSNKAVRDLQHHKQTVYAVGIKPGNIHGVEIITERPHFENIDTVTLYVGPKNQADWIPYVLSLNPKRIIFNPGTENGAFMDEATAKGVACVEACTLVMLSIGNY